PTRGYQCDPPSALLLRRPQEIHMSNGKTLKPIPIDTESHISFLSDGASIAAPSCRSPTISPWRSVVRTSVVELEEAMTILELHRRGLSMAIIAARLSMDRERQCQLEGGAG
uniref:hypothetical protein n=1 Tax=Burkholderia gladioli TaxID=28095 RepID=UPI001ABB2759